MSPTAEPVLDWGQLAAGAGLALNVYRHRNTIADMWATGMRWLGLREADIVVTGASGVGKTQLADLLAEVSGRRSYAQPGLSLSMESRVVQTGVGGLLLSVIPGQGVQNRHVALSEAFGSERLSGWLHVVADGFAAPRSAEHARALEHDAALSNLAALRQENRKIEVREFIEVASIARATWSRSGRPNWLCVVVNKADLYWPELGETWTRYGADQQGAFARELTRLTEDLGRLRFRVAVVPSVAWTQDFVFRDERRECALRDEAERRRINANLVTTIDWLGAG